LNQYNQKQEPKYVNGDQHLKETISSMDHKCFYDIELFNIIKTKGFYDIELFNIIKTKGILVTFF